MQNFQLKQVTTDYIKNELDNIGFEQTYINKVSEKFNYLNIKIYDLTVAQANILKQTALSLGCDCATNKFVITGDAKQSDAILTGSISQIKKIAQKLSFQPFKLKILGEQLEKFLDNTCSSSSKTQIMGILNLTRDSFSDGGQFFEYEDAIKQLNTLIEDGADIVDIGAESTRPGACEIDTNSQLEKILPILDYVNKNNIQIPISIDTRNSKVAYASLDNGASIINDVSGFEFDPDMPNVVGKFRQAKVIIQHTKGNPQDMQNNPTYNNLTDEIFEFLVEKIKLAINCGIKKDNIIIDPGIGFGKTREHNFEILDRWQELRALNCPILIGISRKSLLNMKNATNQEKDIYTLALSAPLIQNGIDFLRVHNVKMHRTLVDTVLLCK